MNLEPQTRTTHARALILAAALLSFGLSVVLFFTGEERAAIFVGLWVPSILSLGAFIAPRRGGVSTTREADDGPLHLHLRDHGLRDRCPSG